MNISINCFIRFMGTKNSYTILMIKWLVIKGKIFVDQIIKIVKKYIHCSLLDRNFISTSSINLISNIIYMYMYIYIYIYMKDTVIISILLRTQLIHRENQLYSKNVLEFNLNFFILAILAIIFWNVFQPERNRLKTEKNCNFLMFLYTYFHSIQYICYQNTSYLLHCKRKQCNYKRKL